MIDSASALRSQVSRQVVHWTAAVNLLEDFESWASAGAWSALERQTGVAIRNAVASAITRLSQRTAVLRAELGVARSREELERVRRQVVRFRGHYVRAETLLDFFVDAINTRTTPRVGALLRACDRLAEKSMARVLGPLNLPLIPVLTYQDKGMGASILRHGLRLWDGTTRNPVATIKIVRHNLFRASSILHEAGHQVAATTGWDREFQGALLKALLPYGRDLASTWAGTSSEIVADAFAFAHSGYASVAALHDVVSGEESSVFAQIPGDPHPVSFLRVLLGVESSRRFFGAGAWDILARAWVDAHPIELAAPDVGEFIRRSLPILPIVVEIALRTPMRAFRGRALAQMVDPLEVKPEVLSALERRAGPALFTSEHWLNQESIRILALTGLMATDTFGRPEFAQRQREEWMIRLGMINRVA